MNNMKWKKKFYKNHISILEFVKITLFLSLLIICKYKFGFYSSLDGWELVTGVWFLIALITNWKQTLLLTALYSISCGILYQWTLCFIYFFWYGSFIIIISMLRKHLVKNILFSSILGFLVGFSIWLFNIPINFIIYGANLSSLKYSLILISSAIPVNFLEGISAFLVIAILFPIFMKIAVLKPWIVDDNVYDYLINIKDKEIPKNKITKIGSLVMKVKMFKRTLISFFKTKNLEIDE